MVLRYANGRFAPSDFDKRKWVFDEQGDTVYVPKIGFVVERYYEKTVEKEYKKVRRYEKTITFSDRSTDLDLYKYFGQKRFNQTLQKFVKDNPKKVVVARVKIWIGKRRFITREFKLTDLKRIVTFKGGKRKGRKYTPKDILAYFIHDRVNDTDWTLYKYDTDTEKLIRKDGKPKHSAKKQVFEVAIRAVSKRAATGVPSVALFPKRRKKVIVKRIKRVR